MISRVVVISDQAVARGGAEAMAVLSAKLLRAAGVPVTLMAGDDGDVPELAALGVDTVAFGGTHLLQAGKLAALAGGLYSARVRRKLAAWIAAHDDDGVIYHVHSWSKFLSPSIFAALRPVRHRLVVHAHDFFALCPNGAFTNYRAGVPCDLVPMSAACLGTDCDKRNYAEKLWRVARQGVLRHYLDVAHAPAAFVLVHRGMAPFFRRAGVPPDRLSVIRNPIDFLDGERVRAERNRLVCFVGRLDPEKGVLDLAAATAAAGLPLRVIGDGPERARLAAAYPDVELMGWCAPDRVTSHLRQARLLAVPSRWRETYGMVVIEALRLGVPVVISDKALIAADVAALGAGIALNTSDITAFSALLTRLGQAHDEVAAMSVRAIAAAAELSQTEAAWRDALLARYRSLAADANGLSRACG